MYHQQVLVLLLIILIYAALNLCHLRSYYCVMRGWNGYSVLFAFCSFNIVNCCCLNIFNLYKILFLFCAFQNIESCLVFVLVYPEINSLLNLYLFLLVNPAYIMTMYWYGIRHPVFIKYKWRRKRKCSKSTVEH